MIPTNRRAMAALLAGAAVALGLVGCSAGQLTQTANQVPAVPGANVTVGVIGLRNLQIAYSGPDGYAAGGNAPLIVRIFNEGSKPVKLTGASAPGSARAVALAGGTGAPSAVPTSAIPTSAAPTSAAPSPTATGSAAPTGSASPSPTGSASPSTAPTNAPAGQETFSIEIPAQSYVLLVPGSGPYLQLVGLTNPLIPGMGVEVTFTFDDGSKAAATLPFAPAPTPVRGSPVVPGENTEHGE